MLNIFVAGIYVGKILSTPKDHIPKFNAKQPQSTDNRISIDDTKVVLDINTNQLEKKFTDIATTQTSEIDISESINKLKIMKG